MSWSDFYLICFMVGFAFSLISFLGGVLHVHLPSKLHLPHGVPSHGGFQHVGAGRQGVHIGPQHTAAGVQAGQGARGPVEVSAFNFFTLMVFLAWFGGTGFLLTHYYRHWFLLGLGFSTLSGLTAAAIVFWFLAKVLLPHETRLDPADFEMVGTLATVTVPIHEEGTGEILFTQGGARHSAGARSDDGKFITRGTEVVVTRYEKGIAYVQKWEELV